MAKTEARCPGCPSGVREAGKYLCRDCWNTMPPSTRSALNRHDSRAMDRLQELYGQVSNGVPLGEIQVSP
jgi:hypothetical protein